MRMRFYNDMTEYDSILNNSDDYLTESDEIDSLEEIEEDFKKRFLLLEDEYSTLLVLVTNKDK